MSKRKAVYRQHLLGLPWGIAMLILCILFTCRVFFGDLYNAFYQPEHWKWWLAVYSFLNLAFLVLTVIILYFSLKGWMKKKPKPNWREILQIGTGVLTLGVLAYCFCVLLVRSFEAFGQAPVHYRGVCKVQYVNHRKASDDYFMRVGNDSVRITSREYRQLFPIVYPFSHVFNTCAKNVDVYYLSGLVWPIDFKIFEKNQ